MEDKSLGKLVGHENLEYAITICKSHLKTEGYPVKYFKHALQTAVCPELSRFHIVSEIHIIPA